MKNRRPCQCGEYRQKALIRNGVCACCAAHPHTQRVAKCPMCGRENLPCDGHHLFAKRAQKVLGNAEFTIAICKNCHSVISAYLHPFMTAQNKCLADNNTSLNWLCAAMLGASTYLAQLVFTSRNHHLVKDVSDTMQRINKYGNV